MVDWQKEEEVLDLIKNDWDYISTVMDLRDELVSLKSSLQEQVSPRKKTHVHHCDRQKRKPGIVIKGLSTVNKMVQLKAQLQEN